jgi:hypothetical protein
MKTTMKSLMAVAALALGLTISALTGCTGYTDASYPSVSYYPPAGQTYQIQRAGEQPQLLGYGDPVLVSQGDGTLRPERYGEIPQVQNYGDPVLAPTWFMAGVPKHQHHRK